MSETQVEGFDSTAYQVAEGVEVAFVTTEGGPVRLEQGDTLPEGVHPDEVARLANGGVLEGVDQVRELAGMREAGDFAGFAPPELANLDELRLRVGTDAELAKAYLDQENARETPRKTWVSHLEGVIADAGEDGPVVSADAGPGEVAVVDGEGA